MFARGFLSIALDLFPASELLTQVRNVLLSRVKLVPQATVHARAVTFSSSFCTVIVRGPLSAAISPQDTHRLVVAASQLIRDNFYLRKKDLAKATESRPRLIHCVKQAIAKARSRTSGRLRHVLAVVAYATMMLADREKLLQRRVNFKPLRTKTNLYQFITMAEVKDIIRGSEVEAEVPTEEADGRGRRQIALRRITDCRVVISRIAPTAVGQ